MLAFCQRCGYSVNGLVNSVFKSMENHKCGKQSKEDQTMSRMKKLVEEFNGLISEHNIQDINPVKKFTSIAVGEKRLAELIEKRVPTKIEDVKVEVVVQTDPRQPSPEVRKLYPKNPDKFRPTVEAKLIQFKMRRDNPDTSRKDYIAACEARGICKGSACAQWPDSMEKLAERFKEVL